MKRGHWQLGVLALVAAAALALAVTPARAQQSLPSDLYGASNLTPEQIQTIRSYAQYWGDLMAAPQDAEQVKQGRRRLLEPLGMNTSETFRTAYAEAVAEQVQEAVASDEVLPRINATILASRLPLNAQVVATVRQGLQDPNPAVRYWAVKALVGRSAALEAQARQQLLQDLDQLLAREQDASVLEQVYQAMVNIGGAGEGAIGRVLTSLNNRVDAHVGQPGLGYRAEHAGMTAAYSRLLEVQAANGGAANLQPLFNQLGRAAVRYMELIGRQGPQAADRGVEETTLATYTQMLTLTAQVLTRLHRESGASTPMPAGLEQNIQARNWGGIVEAAQAFQAMLANPPFNLSQGDLTVAAAPESPAPGTSAPENAAPGDATPGDAAPAPAGGAASQR